ncbi:class I SAM-dependent methyltransferase [Klebsiella pneumoniae]|nr:class I SAM-dependent methyltransferase [Klebsiella pneumoniae]
MKSPEGYLHGVLPGNEKSVLDVGTGPGGVFDFWNWEAKPLELKVCVDIHSFRSDIPNTWFKVKADGCMLPFKDDVFDVVMSCETLEHVPPEKRITFLGELCRVSRRLVFVTASDITKHLGPLQEEIEKKNPFQKYRGFPPLSLFKKRGFKILEKTPHHIKAFWLKEKGDI